jgi:hypothetical protein
VAYTRPAAGAKEPAGHAINADPDDVGSYGCCLHCLGFYRQYNFAKHVSDRCVLRPEIPDRARKLAGRAEMFILGQVGDINAGEALQETIAEIRRDGVGRIVMGDGLILHVGKYNLEHVFIYQTCIHILVEMVYPNSFRFFLPDMRGSVHSYQSTVAQYIVHHTHQRS